MLPAREAKGARDKLASLSNVGDDDVDSTQCCCVVALPDGDAWKRGDVRCDAALALADALGLARIMLLPWASKTPRAHVFCKARDESASLGNVLYMCERVLDSLLKSQEDSYYSRMVSVLARCELLF